MDAARTADNLTFRIDSLADPAKRAAWVDLLHDVFGLDVAEYGRLGIWDQGFRAYSWMDGEVIVANVGLRPLPLVVGGQRIVAGQIHAVATRPAWRRRGLFHDLMRRALDAADRECACVLLYTQAPALYQPFGFRRVAESRFRGRLDLGDASPPRPQTRALSIRDPADRTTILRLFAGRRPVSDHLGLVDNGDIFVFNCLRHHGWRLSFLPDDEALIAWDRMDGATRLHDIVASRMPQAPILASAMELASEADGKSAEFDVLFPPDQLSGAFAPFPHAPEDDDMLCVRGPFPIEGTPLMLPLTAMS